MPLDATLVIYRTLTKSVQKFKRSHHPASVKMHKHSCIAWLGRMTGGQRVTEARQASTEVTVHTMALWSGVNFSDQFRALHIHYTLLLLLAAPIFHILQMSWGIKSLLRCLQVPNGNVRYACKLGLKLCFSFLCFLLIFSTNYQRVILWLYLCTYSDSWWWSGVACLHGWNLSGILFLYFVLPVDLSGLNLKVRAAGWVLFG